jgi:flagellar basal-body rod protein FlgG
MNGAFYIAATGLDAQQRALEVIANNIANMNTPAFRRSSTSFSALMSLARSADDLPLAEIAGATGMSGVRIAATSHDWSPGQIRQTGNSMNLAIAGDGFIELMGPAGQQLLTRGGTLKVDDDGYLADASGNRLRANISVPQGATAITIAADGTVSAALPGDMAAREIGQIGLVQVHDPDSLVDRGNGYYEVTDEDRTTAAKAGDDGAGTFVQGALEQGNVNLSDEMVTMMLVQRAYSASAQVAQAGDQLMSIANGLRR